MHYKWLNEYKNFKSLFICNQEFYTRYQFLKNKNNQFFFQLKEIIY
jgi:hypothetical protein